jgi:hypothetical protein
LGIAEADQGEAGMIQITLLMLGVLFTAILVRGLVRGRLPSRFGTAIRLEQPIRFYLNSFIFAFFALVCFAVAIR